jgi:hypothetical protein
MRDVKKKKTVYNKKGNKNEKTIYGPLLSKIKKGFAEKGYKIFSCIPSLNGTMFQPVKRQINAYIDTNPYTAPSSKKRKATNFEINLEEIMPITI